MKAPPRLRRGSRRGVALLFALGILVLLSVFALSFANLTRLERLAAANMRLQVQAAALAEAGVAQACGQARDAARRRPWVEQSDWWANGSVYPNRLNRHAADPDWGQNLATNAYGGSDRVEIISYDIASKLDVNLDTANIKQALITVGLTSAEYDKIKAARTARGGRLRSRDELRELLVDPTAVDPEARYRAVRDFVTVHSGQRLGVKGVVGGDLPWTYTGGTQPTSPVNLNAAPKVVLEAVLTGVEGRPIAASGEGATEWLRDDFRAPRGVVGVGGAIGISATTAGKLADEIVACRTRGPSPAGLLYSTAHFGGPFRSWAQFDAFLAANATATGILTPAEHALVLALAHAEARHMGYNPDITRRVPDADLFDKLSITKATTSLSIVAAGVLEVRATGWITGFTQRTTTDTSDIAVALPLAEAELDRVVRVFMPMHVSSQADLETAWQNTYPDRSIYQSMPELVPRTDVSGSADPVDGHIRLTTETTVTGGVGAYSTAFRAAAGPSAPYVSSRGAGTLRSGGVVAPDGVVVWRKSWMGDNATMRLATDLPATLGQTGSFECWVKLATPPTIGTDEVLLTVAVDETDLWSGITPAVMGINDYVLPPKLGASVKLERFAGRLRATWFYWGKPTGGISRYVLGLSEMQQDISSWKPGEWHHVTVSWRNTLQDWAAASVGSPRTAAGFPGDGVTLWVDGSAAAPIEAFDYSALEPYLLESVKYHTGRSQTVPVDEGVHVGGFTVATNAGEDIHSTGVTTTTELKRYTNATIDDVFVYTAAVGAGGAVPRNRDLRYEKNPGNVAVLFDIPVGTYCQVGCVAAEVELPTASSARLGIPSGTNVTASVATAPGPTVFARSPTATPTPTALVLESHEVTVSSGIMRLEVLLKGNGLASPVLEGFTILLLPPTQVIEDYRDF
jgi:hypothetical protein